MITDTWKVKDHCAECGFPCRKEACPHYSAGVEYTCDACGKTWVEPLSDKLEYDVHLCGKCCSPETSRILSVKLPERLAGFGNTLSVGDTSFMVFGMPDETGRTTVVRLDQLA